MAIYANTVPYMKATAKRVALPKNGISMMNGKPTGTTEKLGYGNLAFLLTPDIMKSIHVINNKTNLYNDNKYKYYYYNVLYKGMIGPKRYNIRDMQERKRNYDLIKKETTIAPHPLSLLSTTPNRNTYFELYKYYQIYLSLTTDFSPIRKINLFWNYFRSIFNSSQVADYQYKMVLIDADMYDKIGNNLKENLNNPIFILYYTLYKNYELISDLNLDFYIFCKNYVLRFNPSQCDKSSYSVFKREVAKIFNKQTGFESIDEKELDKQEETEIVKQNLSKKFNFTGDKEEDEEITSLDHKEETHLDNKREDKVKEILNKKIDENITKASEELKDIGIDSGTSDASSYVSTKAEIEIENDKALIEDMYKVMNSQRVPTKPISTARDAQMRKRQEELTLNGITFANIKEINSSRREIPKKNVSSSLHTINKNAGVIKFNNINKDYIENVMPNDIVKSFTSLNNKPSKVYVRDIKVEDSSNELNYKDTYHVVLEDEEKNRHTVTVDIPKFLDNKFLWLGGNKKIINRQNFLYPVVKTAPDTVQIVTNYNKLFIRRLGTKSISAVERMIKLIQNNDECIKYFEIGNNSMVNRVYLTTIEYDEFGKVITRFFNNNTEIFFNQKNAIEYAEKHGIEIPDSKIFIGIKNNKAVFLDSNTQLTDSNESICDLIISELPAELENEFMKTHSTKKLIYNTATIMSQAIPFIILLTYWEGMISVFKKMNLKYRFELKKPTELKSNESFIRFKDSYFIYEEDLATSLLMNGLKVIDTENYTMEEYNTTEPYIEYFKKVYGKVSILNAITNYYEFMIDPITEEILQDINLPTDLIELCIYANGLLADESYTPENSQTLSRVRSCEIIPAILYKEISNAYLVYKNSAGKKKISIPKDAVIKQLMALQTVEDYSTLNPVVELEKDRTITSKGYRGINVDRAYSEEKRSYDDSMIGVIGMSTSPDGNVGITRFLTMEPNITSARGYVDIKKDNRAELKDVNLFTPGEMLFPLGNTRDDSIRTAMASKQSKHVIPILNSTPALISNGLDEACKYDLSSDFCVNADMNGKVIDYDEKSKVLIVEYEDGSHRAIDLSSHIVKNGGGGFFLSNELTTKLKVGDKIKKDQPLAWHKDFFRDDKFNGVRMNVGVLEKVAIMSSYDTYNDSTMITEKLAQDAKAEMAFCKQVVLGKNANVYNIRKIGDHVEIGDPLLSYDISFEDSDLNKLLANLSDENKQAVEQGSMNEIKSKYAGKIIDIKIYSAVDLPELSDSLQKIVKSYYNRINEKKKFVSQYDPNNKSIVRCGLLLNETTGKIEPNVYGVIKGQKVQDSVLIEFYISHEDVMGVGDKLAYFTALKSIIGEKIPVGYEPYSEFRQDEEVSSVISSSAILKRQTPSITLTLLGNKVIVELKRRLQEIYNE